MNNTKTPTVEKKIFPLRLPPDLYKKVRNEVQKEKEKGNYSYIPALLKNPYNPPKIKKVR